MYKLNLLVLVLCSLSGISLACDGYSVKVKKLANCVDNSVIQVDPNTTVTLNKDCEVVPITCVRTAGFTKADVKFTISKNGIQMLQGKLDACESAKALPEDILEVLRSFGFPTECPVMKSEICLDGSKKFPLGDKKVLLAMVTGHLKARVEVTHDTPDQKTCVEAEVDILRKP